MNIQQIRKTLLLAVGGVFVWWAWKSPAQDISSASTSMQMPYSVSQVLELEQAKISDVTIIAFIKSSGTSFDLNAAQIVFLRQEGVSDAVIKVMLTQPRTGVTPASVQATAPAPQTAPATAAPAATPAMTTSDPTIITQPAVTYVQTAPPVSYYYPYYPYYGWPVGWGWYGGGWHGGWVGWHGGSGWHGTWGGGWHGGGGWHR